MKENPVKQHYTGLEIAVIGMSCRFPGANHIEEFWENLQNGIESIHFFSGEETEPSNPNRDFLDNPNFIPAKGVLENPGGFDAAFFGYIPLEAEFMDPQTRIFYECCWEALEFSGYNPESYEGLIGIYAGANNNREWEFHTFFNKRTELLGGFRREHLVDRDFLSTRIAYKLDLRGPAITLKTACSTGLAAVDLACRGLLTGQCVIALAGASSLASYSRGYLYWEGMIQSPEGHVRPFDAKSQGTVFSDGAGVVVLKRLKPALEDRDTIQAVIKGTAVNNDGSRKGTYEAPCVQGQEEVIRTAIHMAGVEPESITYIETHGTGTAIGDPIEIEGLKRAFNTKKKGFCALGSVKSNFGHTDSSAGIAGFIKTVLALKHRVIPPSLHFEEPNPKIDFKNSPFYVNTGRIQWKNHGWPLRAGVSSFGIGGTNVHAVLEEAPEPINTSPGKDRQLIMVSARTPPALEKASENLMNHFKKNPDVPIADTAYTLQVGRKFFKFRKMWVTHSSKPDFQIPYLAEARDKYHLIFMFPGQGAQYTNMGLDVYRTEGIFRGEIDRCFDILTDLVDYNLEEILYPGDSTDKQNPPVPDNSSSSNKSYRSNRSNIPHINQTQIAQPLIFAFEYAMAKLLLHWGLKPYAMIGHSIGEYVAACLAGVFSLEDALKVVAVRGKLMQQMPPGAMVGVNLTLEELIPLLKSNNELSLAAVNAPSLCVVSGPHPAVNALENQLKEKGIPYRPLHSSHAFHSPMMDPILKQLEQAFKEISLNKPRLPYISNVSGKWITLEEALTPAYWAQHLRRTVRFQEGLNLLLKDPYAIFMELGPGQSLATFVKKHDYKKEEHVVLNLVKHPKENCGDDYLILNKLGQLWLYGVDIDWQGFYHDEKRQRVPLPTYPFEGQRYWLDEVPASTVPGNLKHDDQSAPGNIKNTFNHGEHREYRGPFYVPSWKRSSSPYVQEPGKPLNWLIFTDGQNTGTGAIGSQLVERLKQSRPQDRFTRVETGDSFGFNPAHNNELIFTVNPRQEKDYRALMAGLKKQEQIPHRIIHLWNVTARNTGESPVHWTENVEIDQYKGFYSLIYIAKAIGMEGIDEKIKIMVLTDQMQEVSGEETLYPTKALVLGPVRIIPLEYPNLHCRSIDVILPETGSDKEKNLLEQLAVEFCADTPDNVLAYRSQYRWVQCFEPAVFPGTVETGTSTPPSSIKNGGVYLITGGVGGIGLELARHLAKNVKTRLILTCRSSFPGREEWQHWLNTHSHQDKTSTRIRKIQEIEAAETGSEIMTFSADVSDYRQMQTLIVQVEKKWGKINGVIHAAGVPGGGMVALKTTGIAGKVLAPKVQGTLVLDKVLKNHPLDFFILFSSINSVVPMFGQVDYFSANAFLDAFAHYKTSHDTLIAVSINWDSWQEVGMAVEVLKQKPGSDQNLRDIDHPLFDRCIHKDQEQLILVTYFNLNRHWVLSEHQIAGIGKGLVPGTTYLEMARQALETFTGHNIGSNHHIMEISDVYFLQPLVVGEAEDRETRFVLKKQTGNQDRFYEFMVQSRGSSRETNWHKHAVGKVRWLENANQPPTHNISTITGEWVTKAVDITPWSPRAEKHNSPGGLLTFGPRWRSTRQVHLGEKQGLALLNLDKKFSAELEFFKLHPALLDSSTGLLFGHIRQSAYIPFAYKRLTMRAPLSRKIYSYCRLSETGAAAQKESLKFDVTIMDEWGKELVDVKEFTMLPVTGEMQGQVKDLPQQPEKQEEHQYLKNGIMVAEGLELFNRILARATGIPGPLPQVVVSTTDLLTAIEHSEVYPLVLQKPGAGNQPIAEPAAGIEPGNLQPRPAISTVYTSPKTETEQKIVEIWQRHLGIQPVGINDDFFELGGDSLNVVQLNGELKKVFNMDIPVTVMFRHQTIRTFAQYLLQEKKRENEGPEEDRSDEIARSKDRLKARRERR